MTDASNQNIEGVGEASAEVDFRDILKRAKSGDDKAIGELCAKTQKYLLLIANQDLNAALLQKVGASDIVQQSFVVANRKIVAFEGETKGEFFAWMKQILLNECRQVSRGFFGTQKRNVELELGTQTAREGTELQISDPHLTPSSEAMHAESTRLVNEALNRLGEVDRTVIEMRNWQELDYAEIGQAIGKSAEATRKIWSRAIQKLEVELKDLKAL